MPGAARPTFRCLIEDLQEGWGNSAQRNALNVEPLQLPPLDQLDHPIVRHAAAVFSGSGNSTLQRESITGLSQPMWYKLKTGRWRGAVLVDDDGQAWICAAGLRRAGESSDFYASFMADVKSRGSTYFLPTAADASRLDLERANDRVSKWEARVHELSWGAFISAVETGSAEFAVPSLSLLPDKRVATVYVTAYIVEDDDAQEGIGDVVVKVTRENWEDQELRDRAEIVILTAINPNEQAWDVTVTEHSANYSMILALLELRALVSYVRKESAPGSSIAGRVAHYTHRESLTDNIVEGRAVKALCGIWFVPRQDPDTRAPCADCEMIYETLPREVRP